ncbi:MAG: hypothetical protein KDA42_06915 [Planctomycetales bacterium]|nr:hypothetical protein [Planctomycetales bacterium]
MMRQRQNRFAFAKARVPRRGAALVLVLMIISLALAVSYGVLRTQETQTRINVNSNFKSESRQAALAGIAVALRKMNDPDWSGVGTSASGTLSPEQSYSYSYSSGDPSLRVGDDDYANLPYRVTVEAVGYSPASPSATNRSQTTIRAVVQLVPRLLNSAAAPANWNTLNSYTVYQFGDRPSYIDLPARIEGPVHLEGTLHLSDNSPAENSVDDWYKKPFDGLIDEVAVFRKALSQAEVQAIYSAAVNGQLVPAYDDQEPTYWYRFEEPYGATLAFDSAGSSAGVYQGPNSGESGARIASGNQAARFDGVDDYVYLGGLDVEGSDMTILAIFKADDFGYSDGRIISKATSPNESDHYWMLSTIDVSGHQRLRFRVRTEYGTSTLIASSGDLYTGQWVFAAAVFNGSTMKLYKNGVEVGSMSKSGELARNSSVPVFIGNNPTQPWESPRTRYLRDVATMHLLEGVDYRPLTGPIELVRSRQSARTLVNLEEDLLASVSDASATTAQLVHPNRIYSYQLFAGGPTYRVPTCNSSLQDTSLGPNPTSNPLGLFFQSGDLDCDDNVHVEGTLIVGTSSSASTLRLRGAGIDIAPATLKSPIGSNDVYHLPTVLVSDDIFVDDDTVANLNGLVVASDNFELKDGADSISLTLAGRLFARDLFLYARSDWDESESWWWDQHWDFLIPLYNQLVALHLPLLPSGGAVSAYLPEYLEANNILDPTPDVLIKPEVSANGGETHYIWPDWTKPIYLPHPDDARPGQLPGLRWDLIRWEEET